MMLTADRRKNAAPQQTTRRPTPRREQPRQDLGNTIGHRWNWRLLFSLRKRFSDFTDMLDEKLSDRAERAILQGDDSIWNAGHRQFNGQNLQLRAPRRKSQ